MPTTSKFSLALPIDVAQKIRAKVSAGEYKDNAEVFRAGVRLLFGRDAQFENWLARKVAAAYDAWKDGEASVLSIDALRAKISSRRPSTAASVDNVIQFSAEAHRQLSALLQFIQINESPEVALEYINSVLDFCAWMRRFSKRAACRRDIRPDIRVTNFEGTVAIAFVENGGSLTVLGIFMAGWQEDSLVESDRREWIDITAG